MADEALDAQVLADATITALRVQDRDAGGMIDAARAVVALVTRWHGPIEKWTDDVAHGAQLLTARIWRRRSSPGGVEAHGDLGPVYVRRNDPDVAMLLGLGTWSPPMVG